MRIFLDTAEVNLIRNYFDTGLIDGVTTNPTLIMKSGRDPEDVYKRQVLLSDRSNLLKVLLEQQLLTQHMQGLVGSCVHFFHALLPYLS